MQEKIENLELVKTVRFQITDSLTNTVKNYKVPNNTFCEKLRNSKKFVEVFTGENVVWWVPFKIKKNLIHRSQIGWDWDVELQKEHNVPSNSHREVTQVNTLSAQLSVGS